MQTNSQIRQSSLAAMKGNWGSAILLYVVSCVLYVPYGILNRGGAIAGLAVPVSYTHLTLPTTPYV